MKRSLLLVTTFVLFVVSGALAQNPPTKVTDSKSGLDAVAAAAKAAAQDEDIVERISPETGEVSYVRKSICPKSGKTLYTSVEYCTRSAKFVNVSPSLKKDCIKSRLKSVPASSGSIQPSGEDKKVKVSAAQRAACSGATGKAKPSPEKGKTKVKLVNNQ